MAKLDPDTDARPGLSCRLIRFSFWFAESSLILCSISVITIKRIAISNRSGPGEKKTSQIVARESRKANDDHGEGLKKTMVMV